MPCKKRMAAAAGHVSHNQIDNYLTTSYMRKTWIMAALGLCVLGACNSHSEEGHDEHGHAAEEAAHGGNEIVLTPARAKAAGVEVSEVKPGTFHQVIQASGQVMTAQGDERVAVATVAGVVSFRNRVVEGMSVAQGTPLVVISSKELAEGDPVQKARVAYEVARKEYERMAKLVGDKIVSEKAFQQARQAYENARIAYEAVARNHSGDGQTVTSPMAGYVKSLLVKEGDYVSVGQPLVSITQNRRLYLRANVSERYYPALKGIVSANFRTPYNERVYDLKALNGRLLSYGKTPGDNSYYLPVTFEFDNKGDIIPGSYVEVFLLANPLEDVICLPESALTEEQGSYFVYRQVDAECYEKQLVTVGASDGEQVQILSGVQPGEHIVTHGAYQVKLASASNAIPPHTHEH